ATQTDPAGNTSDESNEVTVVVDTTAPDAPVIEGPADGTVTNNPSPMLTGTGEPGAVVTVVDGDGNVVLVVDVDEDGNWSGIPDEPLAEGDHTFVATQTDAAGNESPVSNEVTITVDVTAPDAPVITGPADGSSTSDNTPTVSGTGEPGATITVTDGNGDLVCTTVVTGSGFWSCDTPEPLEDGEHTYSVVQTDPAGNVGEP